MSRKFGVVLSSHSKSMVVVVAAIPAARAVAIFLVRAVAVIAGMEAAAAVTLAVVAGMEMLTIDEAMMMEEVAIIRVAAAIILMMEEVAIKREAAAPILMMEEVAIKREEAAMTTKREAAAITTTIIRTSKRVALTNTPREEMTTEKLVLLSVEMPETMITMPDPIMIMPPLIRAMPEGAKRTGEEEAMAIATTDEVGRVVREVEARILARGGRRVVNQLRVAARL